jgi:hypothetical protein
VCTEAVAVVRAVGADFFLDRWHVEIDVKEELLEASPSMLPGSYQRKVDDYSLLELLDSFLSRYVSVLSVYLLQFYIVGLVVFLGYKVLSIQRSARQCAPKDRSLYNRCCEYLNLHMCIFFYIKDVMHKKYIIPCVCVYGRVLLAALHRCL